MSFEPHSDDVVSIHPNNGLTGTKMSKLKDIDQAFKDKLRSAVSVDWFKEGLNCEFLKASTGGGWQKGKIRIREVSIHFEFVPDEPEEPELSPDSNALAPLPESINPE